MSTLKMIDVSHYQGVIDWEKVKAAVDMAVIRIGYRGYGAAGTLNVDPRFAQNIAGAVKAGVPVGVYWCSQALSDAEALDEAAYCYKLLQGIQLALPVFLDSEHMGPNATGRADRIGRARRTQYGLTFLRAMRGNGFKTGLYCSESWYSDELDGEAFRRDGHDLWIAKYSTRQPSVGDIAAWQYTSAGSVPGVAGDVDLSYVFKDWGERPKNYRDAVQQRFGFDDNTMQYLEFYRYGPDLLRKLAEAE